MLKFKDVTFRYEGYDSPMIKDLSFKVEDGEFVSIIGPSGCGKSTLFRLINGLEKVDSGEILVDGVSVEKQKNYSAFMPQKDLLMPWKTVEKNVCLPLEIMKVSKDEQKKKCEEVLRQAGLIEYINAYPKDLSGGMKQRAAFVRTLLAGANMLLLDEPFSALDYLTKVDMQQWLLEQWEKTKRTIIFITHDVEEAIFLSKRIYVIQNYPISDIESVEVPLDYPRSRSDLKRNDVLNLKEELIDKLREK